LKSFLRRNQIKFISRKYFFSGDYDLFLAEALFGAAIQVLAISGVQMAGAQDGVFLEEVEVDPGALWEDHAGSVAVWQANPGDTIRFRRGNCVAIQFILDVPASAHILSAHCGFVGRTDRAVDTLILITAEASVAAESLDPSDSQAVWRRLCGEAEVAWRPEPWLCNTQSRSCNIQPVVQEVVNRAGWTRGAALTLLLLPAYGARSAFGLAHGDARQPRLHVVWRHGGVLLAQVSGRGAVGAAATVQGGQHLRIPILNGTDDGDEGETEQAAVTSRPVLYLAPDRAVGLRFPLPLAPGTRILTALLRLTAHDASTDQCTITIAGEATGDAAALTDTPLSMRRLTKHRVPWRPDGCAAGAVQRTTDVRDIVEEALAFPTWRAGHHVLFVLRVAGGGGRTFHACDGAPALAPRLYIRAVVYRSRTVQEWAATVAPDVDQEPKKTKSNRRRSSEGRGPMVIQPVWEDWA